jgi:hypothetical protein
MLREILPDVTITRIEYTADGEALLQRVEKKSAARYRDSECDASSWNALSSLADIGTIQ